MLQLELFTLCNNYCPVVLPRKITRKSYLNKFQQLDFFIDFLPISERNQEMDISMFPKKWREEKGQHKAKQIKQLLMDGMPYYMISSITGLHDRVISEFAENQGLKSEGAKAFQKSKKKKENPAFVEVYADKSLMELKNANFVLHVRGEGGKAILPHDNQCRRIFAYPTEKGGDFWCQEQREKKHGKGLYCMNCHSEMYS